MIATPLLTVLSLLLIAVVAGLFTSWLRFALGNPITGDDAAPHRAGIEFAGRIFSKTGDWLARRYSAFDCLQELKGAARFFPLQEEIGDWLIAATEEANGIEDESRRVEAIGAISREFHRRHDWLSRQMKLAQRPNPFKAMGICAVCTSFWVYLAMCIVAFLSGVLPLCWALALLPAIAPTAAHIAARTGLD